MKENHWINKLIRFLRLTHEQEDVTIIHDTIEQGIVFRGTNLWILVFAILVASVGLNMNSTAVIIGAMLISPLMGPINGIGYSVATYDVDLLKRSLKNLAFASSAGLIASTIYFLLTPIHTEHSELLARTSPSIYDVLIASFGGFAGIIAISSKNKGNVIPGVAIATALMPPLCTAGYGLSIGNWGYFLGAIYLFIINSVFIALSSMVVTQLLKMPKKTPWLAREIKNKNITIIFVGLLTVVPSFYLGITFVRKEKFKSHADYFVERVSLWDGNYLLDKKIYPENKKIILIYGGNDIDKKSEKRLREKAKDLNLGDAKIVIRQGLKIRDVNALQLKTKEFDKQSDNISRLKKSIRRKNNQLESIKSIPKKGEELLKEIKPLYPQIESCSYASTRVYIDSTKSSRPTDIIFFTSDKPVPEEDQEKIHRWLKSRLKTEDIILKF